MPLADTVAGFEALRAEGKIRAWGVSNFDVADMNELAALPDGRHCAANQVLYNLARRGVEHDLAPLCRERGMVLMAYSPVDQGRLLRQRALVQVAKDLELTPAKVALAWLLTRPGTSVIPKAADQQHVHEIREAADVRLPSDALAALDKAFPPPKGRTPLEML